MGRILEFIRYPSHSRTLGLLAFLVVLLAIPLTVNIAQKQQELRQRASGISVCEQKGGICPQGPQGPCFVQGAQYDAWSCSPTCTPTHAVSCNPACGTPETCGKPSTCIDDCGNTYQGQCDACPATPAPTQAPATAAPAATQPPTTAAPAAVSCPSNDVTTPHSGDTQVWGAACNPSSKSGSSSVAGSIAYAVPGGCTCTVADCQLYPGTTSTYCWVNNGQTYPYVSACNAKGANLPASCTASPGTGGTTTCPAGSGASTCQSGFSPYCTVNGSSTLATHDTSSNTYCCPNGTPWNCQNPSNTNTGSQNCDDFTSQPPCLAAANSCNTTAGTQQGTGNKIGATGSTACTAVPLVKQCNSASPATCTSPNTCNSSNQCVTSSGTTAASTPPPAGSTILTFSNIILDGVGQNTGRVGSQNPPSTGLRSVTVQVLDASGTQVITPLTGSLLYSGGSWITENSISAPGTSLPTGSYIFKIKTSNYIQKSYSASITGGQTNTLSDGRNLPTGDINGNNTVDINDVGILISCSIYSTDNGAACGANSSYKGLSDLNNDGRIDQYDYNLILREFGQSDQ